MYNLRLNDNGGFRDPIQASATTPAAQDKGARDPTAAIGAASVASFFAKEVTPAINLLGAQSRKAIYTRIAGYSVLDFIALAGTLKLSPEVITDTLTHPEVQRKNRTFFAGLGEHAQRVASHWLHYDEKELLKKLQLNKEPSEIKAREFFKGKGEKNREALLTKIDEYYAKYLALKEVAPLRASHTSSWMDRCVTYLIKKYHVGFGNELPELEHISKCGALREVTMLQKNEAIGHLTEKLAQSLYARGFSPGSMRLDCESDRFLVKFNNDSEFDSKPVRQVDVLKVNELVPDEEFIISSGTFIGRESAHLVQRSNAHYLVIHKGKVSGEFNQVRNFCEISGKLTYSAQLLNEKWVVVHGDEISREFDTVDDSPKEVLGKLTYSAQLGDDRWVMVHGAEVSREYCNLDTIPCEIAGKLTYLGQLEDEEKVVVHGNEVSRPYFVVENLLEVDGELTYAAKLRMSYQQVIVQGKKTSNCLGEIYSDVDLIAGKITYATEDHQGRTYMIVHGREVSQKFSTVGSRSEILGKLTYSAELPNGNWVIVHGNEISDEFQAVSVAQKEITGALTYFAALLDGNWVVVHGAKISEPFKNVLPISEIAGKLTYQAELLSGKWVVIHGSSRSEEYQPYLGNSCFVEAFKKRDKTLAELCGKLTYVVRLGNGNKIVVYGNNSSPEFWSVSPIEEVAGKIAYCVKYKAADSNKASGDWEALPFGKSGVVFGDTTYPAFDPTLVPIKAGPLVYLDKHLTGVGLFINGELQQYFPNRKLSDSSAVVQSDKLPHLFEVRLESTKKPSKTEIVRIEIAHPNPDPKLTSGESEILKTLNLVAFPTAEGVKRYLAQDAEFVETRSLSLKEIHSKIASHSRAVARTVNSMIRELPALFTESFRAKTTQSVTPYYEAVIAKIAPHTLYESKIDRRRGSTQNNASLWNHSDSYNLASGDPKHHSNKVLLHSTLGGRFICYGLLSNYQNGRWQRYDAPKHHGIRSGGNVITIKIPLDEERKGKGGSLSLPHFINSSYIPERIHEKGGKRERALELKFMSDGLGVVEPSSSSKEIAYSLRIPNSRALVKSVGALSQVEYERFLTKESLHTKELTGRIAELNETCRQFLGTISSLSPCERILRIKNFISYYGHYDFDNREVAEDKLGMSPGTVLSVMEARALALKGEGRIEPHKEFAGVCIDFSLLFASLLRESGIAAGLATGLVIEKDGNARESSAHAKVFLPFPVDAKNSGTSIAYVEFEANPEGTPSQFETPNFDPDEVESELKELEFDEMFDSSNTTLPDGYSVSEIRKLENGELEHAVNTLMSAMTPENCAHVEALLTVARYAPVENARELTSVARKAIKESSDKEYSDFFALVDGYVERGSKDFPNLSPVKARAKAIESVERLIIRGKRALTAREVSASVAVLCYLKSKKMLGSDDS